VKGFPKHYPQLLRNATIEAQAWSPPSCSPYLLNLTRLAAAQASAPGGTVSTHLALESVAILDTVVSNVVIDAHLPAMEVQALLRPRDTDFRCEKVIRCLSRIAKL